jgi:hypothetical protein
MMTPFSDMYRGVETAVRSIFEGPPFFFRLLLARDYTHDGSVMRNIRAHIARADGFVAEITDLNPNVMLELGAALYGDAGRPAGDATRPILTLRSAATKKDIPIDLRDKIHVGYSSPDAAPEQLRQNIEQAVIKSGRPANREFAGLVRRRKRRFLSETVLASIPVVIDATSMRRLLQSFATIEEVINTSHEELASKAGIAEYLASALQQSLKRTI